MPTELQPGLTRKIFNIASSRLSIGGGRSILRFYAGPGCHCLRTCMRRRMLRSRFFSNSCAGVMYVQLQLIMATSSGSNQQSLPRIPNGRRQRASIDCNGMRELALKLATNSVRIHQFVNYRLRSLTVWLARMRRKILKCVRRGQVLAGVVLKLCKSI